MKKLKFFSLTLVLIAGSLSFMSRNNFNPNGLEVFQTEKMVSVADFKEMVNTDVIAPIVTCYSEAYPHAFMTKCYSSIDFQFTREYQGTADDQLLYANYPVQGNVIFTDCGQENHVCALKVTYSAKEILVQESFLGDWIPLRDYLDRFCKKMKDVEK
jgi:hypothetical protein